MLNILIENI